MLRTRRHQWKKVKTQVNAEMLRGPGLLMCSRHRGQLWISAVWIQMSVGFLAETEKTTLKFVWSREKFMLLRGTRGMLAGLVQGPQPGGACRRRASRAHAHVWRRKVRPESRACAFAAERPRTRWPADPAARVTCVCVCGGSWEALRDTPLCQTKHTAKFELRVDNE